MPSDNSLITSPTKTMILALNYVKFLQNSFVNNVCDLTRFQKLQKTTGDKNKNNYKIGKSCTVTRVAQ